MPKLPPIKHRDFIRKLKRLEFNGPFAGGKHDFLRRHDGMKVTIPNPHQKEISSVLQKIILKQVDISVEDFLAA